MIKSRTTLKQLEAFTFVVDTGTFRSAAAALGTTQPNISARIAALESALNTTLLYRDAGSVRLTEKGAVLLAKARDVLWATEALFEEADRQDLIEERLRLGVTELVACTWLQVFLRLLKREYPNLRVELQVDLSPKIDAALREGQIQLALQNAPFETAVSGSRQLGSEPYVWVANAGIADGLPAGDDLARFFAHPILTHAKHTVACKALHELAAERGYDQSRIVHSSALTACVPMVCEGLGVALLPRSLISGEIADGKLRLLAADWLPEPLFFFARYHADRAPRYIERASRIAEQLRPFRAPQDQENLSP